MRTSPSVTVRYRADMRQQSGVILLLIVLGILGLGAGMLLLTINTANTERSQRKFVSGSQSLIAGKQALLGYAIGSLTGSGARPGWLPLPDTLTDTNYDGKSDATSCLNSAATNGMPALSGVGAQVAALRCLGRLPWNDLGLSIDGASEQDPMGVVPWYAVSPNLADPNAGSGQCMTVLNPTTAALTPTTFTCPTSTTPAWPWLKVCDNTGRILSDRVAAVLILPGEAIKTTGRTQLRTNAATGPNPNGYGFPADFLDAVPTPAGWASIPVAQRCTTFDNAGLSGEFIAAELSSVFNDQLVYITVDELMIEAEKRAALEVSESLKTFRTGYGSYPWMAPVAIPTLVSNTSYTGQLSTRAGLLPFHDYTNAANRFLTELTWNIGGSPAGDTGTFTGTLNNTESEFPCGGGVNPVCTCRARVATSFVAIPRTITTAVFTTIKTGTPNVSTPAVSCQRSSSASKSVRDNTLTCTSYTFTTTTPVTYGIQRRNNSGGNCVTGGTRVNIGNFTGVQTRSITIDLTLFTGTGTASFQAGTAASHPTRSLTNSSVGTAGMLTVTDRWVPDTLGSVPFDQFSGAFPSGMLTGSGATAQTTSVTLSNIRVYPEFPAWYASQNWNEFMYTAFSADLPPAGALGSCGANCFTVGNRTNVDVVAISTGAALAGQTRYSGSPTAASFLESLNATGATTRIFSPPSQPRNTTYADSVVTLPR